MPATTNEIVSDGPARVADATPVRTKIPVPMIAPMPMAVSAHGPSERLQPVFLIGAFGEDRCQRLYSRQHAEPVPSVRPVFEALPGNSQLPENGQYRERAGEDRDGRSVEPAFQDGRVHVAEVDRVLDVTDFFADDGIVAEDAALDAAADQEERRGFAVVGAVAAVLGGAPADSLKVIVSTRLSLPCGPGRRRTPRSHRRAAR